MKQYHIYHATTPGLRFTETKDQPREYVGFVEAENEQIAYQKSQNFELPWNPTNPCRSTSVGDVIQGDEGFFLIKGKFIKYKNNTTLFREIEDFSYTCTIISIVFTEDSNDKVAIITYIWEFD